MAARDAAIHAFPAAPQPNPPLQPLIRPNQNPFLGSAESTVSSPRPSTPKRRAQGGSRVAEGDRAAARSALDAPEHGATIGKTGR